MALRLGEETVKRYIQNLFLKLVGGDRKTVVRQALMLGILYGLIAIRPDQRQIPA